MKNSVTANKSPKAKFLKPAAFVSAAALLAGGYLLIQSKDTKESAEQIITNNQLKDRIENNPYLPGAVKNQNLIFSENPHDQCEANVLPSYINISMTWGTSSYMKKLKAHKALSPPSVIVTSAGNDAIERPPRPLIDDIKKRASKEFDAIIVGSLTPEGHRSWFSQKGGEVAIMAPSNRELTTTDMSGKYNKFGGTSGATPLVTGALAGFTWLSGFQPTGEEAKILLKKTAIPIRLSNENPPMNGPGMLNSYKLGMVGKRLKELCGTDLNCFKSKLREDSTYQFPEDPDLPEAVERAFPECSDRCLEQSLSDCSDKAAVFKQLRKAAFLNPASNKKLWRYLSCIYASSGFEDNARGMQNIYDALSGAPPAESIDDRGNNYTDISCNRDEDCALVIDCFRARSSPSTILYYPDLLQVANKDYVPHCQGPGLCNGKCRCDSEEEGEIIDLDDGKWSTRCVNAKCVAVKAVSSSDSGSR